MRGKSRRFSTTHWSVVLAAGQASSARTQRALSTLCETYWYPLYAFARGRGHEAEDARDLTQAFFARLLQKRDFGAVGPERGRFRTWLLAAFKHFLANDWDKTQTKKRGGGEAHVSIDAGTAEGRYRLEPADDRTPETVFARRWTLSLLDAVRAALRAAHVEKGTLPLFEALQGTLGVGEEPNYAQLAQGLDTTPDALKVAAFRLRRKYGELLRAQIGHTLERPEEIDDEIRGLFAALAGGR